MNRPALHRQLVSITRSLEKAAEELLVIDPLGAVSLQSHLDGIAKVAENLAVPRLSDPLPPGQARVLTFICQYLAEHGIAPTRKEIADALGFSSANAAQEHLKALDAKGVLTLTGSEPRAIRLNKRTALSTLTEGNTP